MMLQLFAENGAGDGNGAGTNTQQGNTAAAPQNGQSAPGVDYDKIQAMLDTAIAKKENAV